MPGFSYDNYCYTTMTDVVNAASSEKPVYIQSGVLTSTVTNAGSVLTYNYSLKPFDTTIPITFSMTKTIPSCPNIGMLHNESGLTVEDVVTTSWLVIAVWVAAFYFRSLRRAL